MSSASASLTEAFIEVSWRTFPVGGSSSPCVAAAAARSATRLARLRCLEGPFLDLCWAGPGVGDGHLLLVAHEGQHNTKTNPCLSGMCFYCQVSS